MVLSRYHENEQNCDLKNLIIFIAGTVAHLQEVKLDKLIYIAHLYYFVKHGKQLTSTRFISLTYGPHAPAIRSAINILIRDKSIFFEASRTSTDPIYSNPCSIIKISGPYHRNLSSSQVDTLQAVLYDWADKQYGPILDYTARTIPCLSTPYREAIDWTSIRPHNALKDVLSFQQRSWIHRFVESPETQMNKSDARTSITAVSANEVAEIYLALCGAQPEMTPPREYLGFDLGSVTRSLDILADNSKIGLTEYTSKIDQAATISNSLLNSLSFRGHSVRVALLTGMLFLRKSGCVLDGDVLERDWPDDNTYDAIRSWFQKVCNRAYTTKSSF